MKKLIPLLLPVIGIGVGVGAGLFLQPSPQHQTETPAAETGHAEQTAASTHSDEHGETIHDPQYVKLNNQFVVPIIDHDMVTSIVVLSLSLELMSGDSESVYAKEPKLRDGFLQVLFDHSNMGGFHGTFTNTSKMDTLRRSLLSVARQAVGGNVSDVLITDLARQDV